jgi:hypothetical protein
LPDGIGTMMNSTTAERYLQCHRAGLRSCALVEKAVRFTENDAVLKQMLNEQEAFDGKIAGAIQAIHPPEDLKHRLSTRAEESKCSGKKKRPQFMVPIVLTMIFGVLSIIGLLVFTEMDAISHFPGRESAERMIETANGMSGIELEPISSPTGQLGDWFLLRGLDFYSVPEEFAPLPAVGVRIFQLDAKPVAQVAIDRHNCILYVFRASDFGVDLPQESEWKLFDHQGWSGAIRRRDNTCSLVIFQGKKEEMQAFLHSLQKP